MSTAEQRIRYLQKQLETLTKQKLTPASKRSRNPAQEIHAAGSGFDSKGNPEVIIFKLATVQPTYAQGQELVYKAHCECRRVIAVQTIYKGTNAIWPPAEGYPEQCQACQGGEA